MELLDQEYQMLPVTALRPHPDNPNVGDKAALADSVDENGWYGAVVVHTHPDEPGAYQILAGEHRWRLACEHAEIEVPAIVVKTRDEVHAVRILLADNEVTRRGTYDQDTVDRVLDRLGSLKGTGFDRELKAAEDELDDEEEAQKKAQREASKDDEPYSDDDDSEGSFEKEYGVLVTCESELEQASVFEYLAQTYGVTKLRVVAI